jgi:hypothetical protein
MIGPKKLSEIRAELRAGFDMTDKELLAWFNREIQALERQEPTGRTGRETMRSLRDALLAPAKKRNALSGKRKGKKKGSRIILKGS